MSFDKIIANPPFDKNLHLKILREAMKHSDEIINLSPIRWLQDPLAEYKRGSDWKKFEDIRNHIESIDYLDSAEVSAVFNAALTFDMGIYHITKNGGANLSCINKIVDKIVKSGSVGVPVTKVCNAKKKFFCLVTTLDGGHKERLNSPGSTYDFIRNETWYGRYYENGVSTNGMTLDENKARNKMSTNGNPNEWACVEFDSKEEAENFYKFTKTKLFKYVYKIEMVDVNVHPQFLPFLPTYQKQWTDADLYEYFNLTPEEIKIIEEEMK
jgi:hypothetical protein